MANRILIIDGNKHFCKLLKLHFTKDGFEVNTAYSGPDGLKQLGLNIPDMVLCGDNIEQLSYIEILQLMKGSEKYRNIPFMLVLENCNRFSFMQGIFKGIDGMILRDFHVQVIINIVREKLTCFEKIYNEIDLNVVKFIENPTVSYLLTDKNKIIFANKKFISNFSDNNKDINELTLQSFFPEEDMELLTENMIFLLTETTDKIHLILKIRKNNEFINVSLYGSLLFYQKKKVIVLSVTEIDEITANHQRYEQGNKAQEYINLTEREMEILELICHGLTSSEIAAKLFISDRTVQGHRMRMMRKINAKNTADLVKYAVVNKLF